MKIVAWNVNSIRTLIKEDHLENLIKKEKPDIICFGETKLSCKCIEVIPCKCRVIYPDKEKLKCKCPFTELDEELKEKIKGYKYRYWHHSRAKTGYSGTAIFCKKEPEKITLGLKSNDKDYDDEGRMITLEYDNFILVHVYTPNSGEELKRLDYRVNTWDVKFREYIKNLKSNKTVIICGDLNVARAEIDLKNPKTNTKTAGFTKEERESFEKLLEENNLIDTYRYLNPEKIEYSYWSYRFNSRAKNAGWRIDYFLVNEKYIKKVKNSEILTEYFGSDHAPIKLNIKI
jgi:exodeoxyribonuclease-3